MPSTLSAWAFYVSNLGIVAGYLTASLLMARRKASAESMSWRAWIAGTSFFVLCGLTHVELAVHAFSGDTLLEADGTRP